MLSCFIQKISPHFLNKKHTCSRFVSLYCPVIYPEIVLRLGKGFTGFFQSFKLHPISPWIPQLISKTLDTLNPVKDICSTSLKVSICKYFKKFLFRVYPILVPLREVPRKMTTFLLLNPILL